MDEKTLNLTRRKFVLLGSAAVSSPLLLNLPGVVTEAKGAITDAHTIYYISRQCIGCQVCRMFCPANAIHFADCRNQIDQEKCEHCGTCFDECPISAISETKL